MAVKSVADVGSAFDFGRGEVAAVVEVSTVFDVVAAEFAVGAGGFGCDSDE